MRRREFLKTAGLGGLAAGVSAAFPGILRAAPCPAPSGWGEITCSLSWGAATSASKVLEIFLWGGMAPWESFYYRAGGGTTRGFDPDVGALVWNAAAHCGATPGGLVTQPFATDSNTKAVDLGPFAMPLWRSDLRNRLRVIVLAHELMPHEAAIPFNVTGRKLGRPDFTGLGAPLQRRARVLDPGGTHPLPFSYCLLTGFGTTQPVFRGLSAVASHGGASKPLVLKIDATYAGFPAQLGRANIATGVDGLIEHYRAAYRDWLRFTGSTSVTRSQSFADYDAAVASLFDAPQLATLLSTGPSTLTPQDACSRQPSDAGFAGGTGTTEAQLELAAYLLTRTGPEATSYVSVVDGGTGGAGFAYDVHDSAAGDGQARRTSSHLWSTLSKLASLIKDPANPDPVNDPNRIDLDDTLIVIKTEFGRTPFRSKFSSPDPTSNGRDHWPQGYCWALLGGPVSAGHHGVVGSIGDEGTADEGVADIAYSPTDVSAAALLGAGVDPFAPGSFQIGQLTGSLQGGDHEATMQNLLDTILGV